MCKMHYATAVKLLFALALSSNLFGMQELVTLSDTKKGADKVWVEACGMSKNAILSLIKHTNEGKAIMSVNLASLLSREPQEREYFCMPDLLHIAQKGDVESAQLLFDFGGITAAEHAEVEHAEGVNALHVAAEHGHTKMVTFLLDKGFAIDHTDFNGLTPLMRASYYGHIDMVKLLLARGARKNVQNEHGITALDLAIIAQNSEMVCVLYDAGAKQKMTIRLTIGQ